MPTSARNRPTAVRNMPAYVFNMPTCVKNMPTSVTILACDNKVDEHALGWVSRVLPQVINVDVDLPKEKIQFKSRETINLSTQPSLYCYVKYALCNLTKGNNLAGD
jgi:hypothetical protein